MSITPMSNTHSLQSALRQSRSLIIAALVFAMALNVLYLAPSLYMLQVYDRVLATGGITTLIFLSAILIFALAVLTWLDAHRARLMMRVSIRLDRLLAPRLLDLASQRPPADTDRTNLMREFDTLRQAIAGPAATALMDAPWAPIFILVCALIHPLIGVAVLVGGLILVGVAYLTDRNQRQDLQALSGLTPRVYAAQEADAAAGATARVLGMGEALIARSLDRRRVMDTYQTSVGLRASSYGAVTKFLRLGLQSGVLGLGAWLAIQQQISPGAMIAASILSSRALAPLEQIVNGWRQIGQALISYRRINAALETSPAPAPRTLLPKPVGRLQVEDVSVVLPGAPTPALSSISFDVAPGEIVALLGPSGAGKSTLAAAAVGALSPSHGKVRLDGASLTDWDPAQLGAHVGYLPQEVHLLAGTIAENIRRFTTQTPENVASLDEATIAAAKLVGVHDMILRFPQAYETVLGLGGAGLSMGQAQRVALARAFFGDPNLIVLDEPNAHLDAEGEGALNRALEKARARGASVIIVAHRAGILVHADRVLVLQDGRIRALGPKEHILAATRGSVEGRPAHAELSQ